MLKKENLGKVAVTVEKEPWSNEKNYDRLTIVKKENDYATYISRKPVLAGTPLTDTDYWMPFSSLKESIIIDYNQFINRYQEIIDDIYRKLDNIELEKCIGTFATKELADTEALVLIREYGVDTPKMCYYKVTNSDSYNIGVVYTYSKNDNTYIQLLIWDNKLYYRDIVAIERQGRIHWTVSDWIEGLPTEWLGNNIEWDNLSESLQEKINSDTGVELVSELGDSEEKGITQKKITEELTNIKQDINDIIADSANINFTVSPNCMLVNTTANVSLNATSDVSTAIKLFKNDVELTSGSGVSLSYRDTVAGRQPMTVTYRAEFIFGTKTRSITKTTVVTDAVRYGAGMDSSSAVSDNIARINPNGTYNINVSTNGLYVWFIVPDNMTIHKATLSGFDFPLEAPIIEISDNRRFKVYRSSNTYDAGNLAIVIS